MFKNLLIIFLLLGGLAYSKTNVPIMLPEPEIDSKLISETDSKKLKEVLVISAQSGIFKAQKQIRGVSFSLIDEKSQEDALKEQAGQRAKGCYDNECLVDTGRMLAAQKLLRFSLKEISKNSWRISGRVINIESGAIENVEVGYCKECNHSTPEMLEVKVSEISEKLLLSLHEDSVISSSSSDMVGESKINTTSISHKALDSQLEKNKQKAFDRLNALTKEIDEDEGIIAPLTSSSVREALNYYIGLNKQNISKEQAFKIMEKAAQRGDVVAMGWLGIFYHQGVGVAKDSYRGAEWCNKSISNSLENLAILKKDSEAAVVMGIFYDNGYGGVKPNYSDAYKLYLLAENHPIALTNIAVMHYYGNYVDYSIDSALQYFQKSGEMGDAVAQSWLGYIYKEEKTKINYNLSYYWYLKGASQKDLYSIRNLGVLIFNGQGVERNEKEAFNWFLYAAQRDEMSAQSWVGYCYQYGKGVTKNTSEARVWYEKAAISGDGYSMTNLGFIYFDEQNYSKALDWFQKGGDAGNSDAINKLGEIYYNGYGVTPNLNKAFEYFEKGAAKNNKISQSWVAYCYHYGKGVTKNLTEARRWYQKAIDNGDVYSIHNMALSYYEEGAYITALSWFQKGADKNYSTSIYYLGFIYENGYGVTADYTKATTYYQKGSEAGSYDAMAALGILYFNGKGVTQNYSTAFEYFTKASENSKTAMEWMGYCYEFGYGVSQNQKEAVSFYKKALLKGSTYAPQRLDVLKGQGFY